MSQHWYVYSQRYVTHLTRPTYKLASAYTLMLTHMHTHTRTRTRTQRKHAYRQRQKDIHDDVSVRCSHSKATVDSTVEAQRQLLNQQYADSYAYNTMLRSSLQGPGKAKRGVQDHLF
jgi:hypothetical protein